MSFRFDSIVFSFYFFFGNIVPTHTMVWSLDFDGCLSNETFHRERELRKQRLTALAPATPFKQLRDTQSELIVTTNRLIIEKITAEIKEKSPQLVKIMNGSNRQSSAINIFNGGASVFDELPHVCNALPGAALDATLLPDVFCDLEFGETWRRIRESDHVGALPGCPLEDHKILLLYLQMQHMATKHMTNNDSLEYHFVDDRTDILEPLHEYFSKNSNMIPMGMTLALHRYNGTDSTRMPIIHGTGDIDKAFRKTIIAFTIAAGQPIQSGWNLPMVKIHRLSSSTHDSVIISKAELDLSTCFKEPVSLPPLSSGHSSSADLVHHPALAHSNFFREVPRYASWPDDDQVASSPASEPFGSEASGSPMAYY